MKLKNSHQKLPTNFLDREVLRNKGQFWTPSWVAEAMISYLALNKKNNLIFDPAVGEGIFFKTAKEIGKETGREFNFQGRDIDVTAVNRAANNGLSNKEVSGVLIKDFLMDPPKRKFLAIVANPPYIRHHRLSKELKEKLKNFSEEILGKAIDGRAGLHIYFLIQSLELLEKDGRLAFIMPSDTCEGKFAESLWSWITKKYNLESVITFSPKATPFPGVDTNAMVFFIKNNKQNSKFIWSYCKKSNISDLKKWVLSDFKSFNKGVLEVKQRDIKEGISTGLSREQRSLELSGSTNLKGFANVMRGVATGNNNFFFLTKKQADERGIPEEFRVLAVGRTKDVEGDEITEQTLTNLEAKERPTILFSPDGRSIDGFPLKTKEYLLKGKNSKVNNGALVKTRKPWYKMEKRQPPPFLFTYLGRRNSRFIKNSAGVIPLTGFLCVYPLRNEKDFEEKLWKVLNHKKVLENLKLVGKSYGGGSIKVEPRGLERLPLPREVLEEFGLN